MIAGSLVCSEIVKLNTIHKLIFSLFLFTVLIVALHWQFGESKRYQISPSEFAFLATNDQVQNGASVSSIEQNGKAVALNCELKASEDYPWPYCGVSIKYDEHDPSKGFDFSDYHTVRLDVDFINLDGGAKPALRFYLRNFNPAYSTTENEYTFKYNGLDYRQADYNQVLEIPLNNMQVMTWWLVDNQISIEHAGPEFSNVNRIEFATGSGTAQGRYQLKINSIEFVGHYIDGENLLFSLLILWITLAMVFSGLEIRNSRLKIAHYEVRRKHLKSLNRKLTEQNIEFAEQANRDALTGAMNRHAVRGWLETQFNCRESLDEPLAIIYLDIDHFKRVNDLYGHKMGDDILREFTMVTMTELRATDRLVRWGGEEFVIFCASTSLKQAAMLAERLRQKIELYPWMHGEVLTASLGVTQLEDETVLDMVARADELLYVAKHSGRNRVEINGM